MATTAATLPWPKEPLPSGTGQFPSVTHDSPVTQTVYGAAASVSASLIASITSGAPYFKITQLQCCNVTWQAQASGLPVGSGELPVGDKPTHNPVTIEQVPVLTPAGTSNGVTPLPVQKDQWIGLTVVVDVPQSASLPPGPFTGTAVIQGTGFSQTVKLSCIYLAVDLNSPIGRKWQALGGEAKLGAVLTLPATAPDGKGTIQTFANGVLYEVPLPSGGQGTPSVFYLSNAVYSKWLSLRGSSDATGAPVWSTLGFPVADTFATKEGGQACPYQGGVIVVRKAGQAWVVYGAIYQHYVGFGPLNSSNEPWIGLPTADENPVDSISPDWERVSTFDGGNIYWSSSTGAHEMHGLILQHWSAVIAQNMTPGTPTSDQTAAADDVGQFNTFQDGAMYWSAKTGVCYLYGPILDRWNSLGGINSYLGYPLSDVTTWSSPPAGKTGNVCSFQYGQIGATTDGTVYEMPASVTKTASGSGSADFGNVSYSGTVTLKSDGEYAFSFQVQDNAANGYSFQITAAVTAPGGIWLGAAHSGSVAGALSTSGSKTDNYDESGKHPWIASNWLSLAGGFDLQVSISGSANGVAGFLADQVKTLLTALAASAVGGPVLGAVVFLGEEASQANLGISGTIGVIAGVAAFALTGGVVWAVAAGVAAGEVTAANIQQRTISSEEYAFANNVFHNTLPPITQIRLTNLSSVNGRAFTAPSTDGNIYMNLGAAYGSPMTYTNGAYPRPGEVFIHEMTHVWQIYHSSFVPGLICQAVVNQTKYTLGTNVYAYGPPTTPWDSFNLEEQGAVVDQWFGGVPHEWAPTRTGSYTTNEDPSSPTFGVSDAYYPYIQNNIRAGKT